MLGQEWSLTQSQQDHVDGLQQEIQTMIEMEMENSWMIIPDHPDHSDHPDHPDRRDHRDGLNY